MYLHTFHCWELIKTDNIGRLHGRLSLITASHDERDGLKFCKQLPSYCKVMVVLNCYVTFKVMWNLICYFIHMLKVGCSKFSTCFRWMHVPLISHFWHPTLTLWMVAWCVCLKGSNCKGALLQYNQQWQHVAADTVFMFVCKTHSLCKS